MKLNLKFGLVVLLLVSLTLGVAIWLLVRNEAELRLLQQRTVALQEDALIKEARERAATVTSFGEACRAYTQNVLSPAVEKHLGEKIVFEAQSRTFVARGTFEELRRSPGMADYSFREASLNPLNRKKNLANAEEKKLIERFVADRTLTEQSGFLQRDRHELYFVARPIVVENSCLRCHGRPEEAPPEVTAAYGHESGFGWQPGDINGILMITAPTDDLKQHAGLFRNEWQQLADQHHATNRAMLLVFVVSGLVLIGALAGFFHLLVERRVRLAAEVMRQVASNVTASARIADSSGDEISVMAQAFNRMADSLETAHRELERRVQDRTEELSKANGRLEQQMVELERFSKLAVGREQRMIELKQQVNDLARALGKPAPHDLSFLGG